VALRAESGFLIYDLPFRKRGDSDVSLLEILAVILVNLADFKSGLEIVSTGSSG
jgi:hypothetical protein